MGHFNAAFLAGSLRVTVENKCPAVTLLIELDRGRICEFAASFREDHREHLHEEFPAQLFIQRIENGSLLSLQFVSEQLIFFHKRRDIHMNNSAAMLNQIVPSDYIFRIIIFDAF